jgi:hypothetical protein
VEKSVNGSAVAADIELKTKLQRFLIPSGPGCPAGLLQEGASLPELLEGVEVRRMFECGHWV